MGTTTMVIVKRVTLAHWGMDNSGGRLLLLMMVVGEWDGGGWKVRSMMQRSAGCFSIKRGAKIEREIVSRTQQRVSVSLRKRLDR